MLSQRLQAALDEQVVGQPRAIQAMVRAVTVALGGIDSDAAPLGLYLFMGPSGTGKTHLARSLTRLMHGDANPLLVADCLQLSTQQEWSSLVQQVAPRFSSLPGSRSDTVLRLPPLSVLLIENIDAAPPETVPALISAIEAGSLLLPDGKIGSLAGCLVLLTTSLCSEEISDSARQGIGFSSATGEARDNERARIYELCCVAVEKGWGHDTLGRLDDLLVFHPLAEEHLPFIMRRQLAELSARLAERCISCTLAPEVESLLLARAMRSLRGGAWVIPRVFHRFVAFPLADLLHEGKIGNGSTIHVELDEDQTLCFNVETAAADAAPAAPVIQQSQIRVAWAQSARD